jgi:hypothetical protein
MPISRPCYCTREDVLSATDITLTTDYARHIDSAIESASDSLDGGYPNPGGSGLLKRTFYPYDRTAYFDWPNYQYAYPWRIWFDAAELADVTVTVPTVTTGGQSIPDSAIFWGDPNYPEAPFTYMELDRSQDYAFGVGPTPQRDVAITGTFGYDLITESAGSLASNLAATTTATANITWTTARFGVGDLLVIDSERMLITDRSYVDTSQTLQADMDALASATTVSVTDGTDFTTEEIIQLDSELMFISSITGNDLTVIRAWDGSTLAAHSGSEIYAYLGVQLTRAVCGTAIASHDTDAVIYRKVYPAGVHELALAEALNTVFQKTSGYARTIGEAGAAPVPGGSLPDFRAQVFQRYARKSRQRVI